MEVLQGMRDERVGVVMIASEDTWGRSDWVGMYMNNSYHAVQLNVTYHDENEEGSVQV